METWEAAASRLEVARRASRSYTTLDPVESRNPTAGEFHRLLCCLEKYHPGAWESDHRMVVASHETRRDLSLYGVTPGSTFLQIVDDPAISPVIQRAETAASNSVVILGCSVGWACAYASYVLGLPSRGCDLVGERVAFGRAALEEAMPHGPVAAATPVVLSEADASTFPVSDACFVMEITSFGDSEPRLAIWRHLAADLVPGAICAVPLLAPVRLRPCVRR